MRSTGSRDDDLGTSPRHALAFAASAGGAEGGAWALHPGGFNLTAREIIRLRENRMIFSGLNSPATSRFRDVIIHSTVLAEDDMLLLDSPWSEVDPVEVIDQYDADASRYGLMKMSSTRTPASRTRRSEEAATRTSSGTSRG